MRFCLRAIAQVWLVLAARTGRYRRLNLPKVGLRACSTTRPADMAAVCQPPCTLPRYARGGDFLSLRAVCVAFHEVANDVLRDYMMPPWHSAVLPDGREIRPAFTDALGERLSRLLYKYVSETPCDSARAARHLNVRSRRLAPEQHWDKQGAAHEPRVCSLPFHADLSRCSKCAGSCIHCWRRADSRHPVF